MDNLELYTSELLMLKALLTYDMEQDFSNGFGYDIDYANVDLMQHYLDRATVLHKVQELLEA